MAIIKCPECGHQVSDHAKTCPNCGIEIEGNIKKCPECGEIVFKEADSCQACHHQFAGHAVAPAGSQPDGSEVVQVVAQYESDGREDAGRPRGSNGRGRRVTTIVAVAFVIALLVVFGGMYFYQNTQEKNEIEAYQNAMASDEPAVLANFLDIYTDAPAAHRDSVSARLDNLKRVDTEWDNAVASGSKAAIERYVKMHPNSVHLVEAKLKIDSLDWVAATEDNTVEAYKAYMENHAEGLYVYEAQKRFEELDAQQVTDKDKQDVSSLFSGYFTALAANDEDGVTACLANIMTSFLHKADATKVDVIEYMKRMHSQADITRMSFRMNNDWKIEKIPAADGAYGYSVTFSVDQKLEHTDPANNAFTTLKVEAKVSPDMKISELNMKKIVQ